MTVHALIVIAQHGGIVHQMKTRYQIEKTYSYPMLFEENIFNASQELAN